MSRPIPWALPCFLRFLYTFLAFWPFFLKALHMAVDTADDMASATATSRISSAFDSSPICAGVSAAHSSGVKPKRTAAHAHP